MSDVDQVASWLLRQPGMQSLRFIGPEQKDICRQALVEIASMPLFVGEVDLKDVRDEADLLQRFDGPISAPSPIINWGAFGDWMHDLSWLPSQQGFIFYLSCSLNLWRNNTLLAGVLCEEFQIAAFHWAQRQTPFVVIFELT